MENANLGDGSRHAAIVNPEHADTMFNQDQAETHMVKIVDGKLTPMGRTSDDVMDDQMQGFQTDEERALQTDPDQKIYERSAAALRAGNVVDPALVPDNPIAEAELTGNPDAGDDQETGLPSEAGQSPTDTAYQPRSERSEPQTDGEGGHFPNVAAATQRTHNDSEQWHNQSAGGEQPSTDTSGFGVWADMVPPTPSTPDPGNPVPAAPETPQPPSPGPVQPEIPELPGSPSPDRPEITDPNQPGRGHEINANVSYATGGLATFTTGSPMGDVEPGEAVPGNQYDGLSANGADEGMDRDPATGDSSHPYDVNADDATPYQPAERPQETAQMMSQPRESMDESSVKAQEMTPDGDRSDTKSTDGLDRPYNDPQAARDMAT